MCYYPLQRNQKQKIWMHVYQSTEKTEKKKRKGKWSNFSVPVIPWHCWQPPKRYKFSTHFLSLNVFNYSVIIEGVSGILWKPLDLAGWCKRRKGSGWLSFSPLLIVKNLKIEKYNNNGVKKALGKQMQWRFSEAIFFFLIYGYLELFQLLINRE